MTRLGNRIAVTPVSRSKKLDGSGQKGGAPVARYANAVPKRTKSRPRLRRRRLRPSKQEILTAVRPPRNLLARSLLRPPLSVFSRLSNAIPFQAKIRRIPATRRWQDPLVIVVHPKY